MAAQVFTIPAGTAFADALARGTVARLDLDTDPFALTRATIYLPTRRATRTVADAFARVLGGAALLPELRALGDVDEDEWLLDPAADALDLPPEIAPVRQALLLATLVQHWDRARRDSALTFAQAVALAEGLAAFLAEAETQGVDLAKLEQLAPDGLAEHWREVNDFLSLLHAEWPALLAVDGTMNPAARRNATLEALRERIVSQPAQGLVIAAGSTGSIPATAELLRTIAHLPNGAVVLPDLDRVLDAGSWAELDPGHPQYGLKHLLMRIGSERGDVADWIEGIENPRAVLLSETLRPAPTTDAWRAIAEGGGADIAGGLDGLTLVEAAHPGEEAAAVALILRQTLERCGATAALVTPDRNLARRVSAELRRWDITIDDSAGRPLAHTAPGAFLCLLLDAAESAFAPVQLLALLKHPLAACGQPAAVFREHARGFDRLCLRGPRPDPGLAGIAARIAAGGKDTALAQWFARVAGCLAPLGELMAAETLRIDDAVARHVEAAEALATTDTESGGARLWQGDAGDAAAALFRDLSSATANIPAIEAGSYPALFGTLALRRAVRPAYGSHPRLAILGPLEARLQSFDVTVLGGLNEDSWPRTPPHDAWLSRPMRKALGLEQPERAIGLSAHDFATLAAAPRVVLTRALKSGGTPTVPSRWWQRLVQLTKGLGLHERLTEGTDTAALARLLDQPRARELPIGKPRPVPPVSKRPRSLSVTEIETWLRDPYAIYAKHVLRLAPLEALDAEVGALERGTAVHAALERFLKQHPDTLPENAELALADTARRVFDEISLPRAARAIWYPRFLRAAHWFVAEERRRREGITRSHVEIRGTRDFEGPAGPFTLRARADRIDELRAGGAAIVDYKTGRPPTKSQVAALLAPQLPLEGAILADGGFPGLGELAPTELVYIRFGGGAEPGEILPVSGDIATLVHDAEDRLRERIAEFDREETPYFPRVMPVRADLVGDYDHLARVREWSLTGWEDDGE